MFKICLKDYFLHFVATINTCTKLYFCSKKGFWTLHFYFENHIDRNIYFRTMNSYCKYFILDPNRPEDYKTPCILVLKNNNALPCCIYKTTRMFVNRPVESGLSSRRSAFRGTISCVCWSGYLTLSLKVFVLRRL